MYDGIYIAAQARRAITLERSNGSEKGEKLVLEYLDMTTKITAVKGYSSDAGKSITYQFNDAGNVVCMYDELGYAQSAKFESGIPNTASQTWFPTWTFQRTGRRRRAERTQWRGILR